MNPSLHMVLSHGHLFIESVPKTMSIGLFSEEPMEATHKKIKNYEINRACQKSRHRRLRDVYQRQMDLIDPLILSRHFKWNHKKYIQPKKSDYPEEVLNLQIDEELELEQ